jgi:branched-chain amino acid transport system permease protein
MGGIHTFSGPIVGSILFFLIKDVIMRFTEYWLICFGVIVVAMVMCFPSGIMSLFENRRRPAPSVERP